MTGCRRKMEKWWCASPPPSPHRTSMWPSSSPWRRTNKSAALFVAPICLAQDKPSQDIFPRQWLRHAGEEIPGQDALLDTTQQGQCSNLGRRTIVAADPVVIDADLPGVGTHAQACAGDGVAGIGVGTDKSDRIAGRFKATCGDKATPQFHRHIHSVVAVTQSRFRHHRGKTSK